MGDDSRRPLDRVDLRDQRGVDQAGPLEYLLVRPLRVLAAGVFNPVPYPGGPPGDVDLYLNPNMVPGCFATGVPASQAAVIAATQRPLAASASTEPYGPPAWKSVPSWAVIGTGDRVIPPAELTSMAQRACAHITDVNAGHLSLISKPSVVTRVILAAVQATG